MKTLFGLSAIAIVAFTPRGVGVGERVDMSPPVELREKEHTQSPTPTPLVVKDNDVKGLIRQYFGEDWPTACAIAYAESGLNCGAVGDHTLDPKSYGVFQIRAFVGRPPVEDLLNCRKNIEYAKKIYDRQGWGAWSAYNNKSYLKFIQAE